MRSTSKHKTRFYVVSEIDYGRPIRSRLVRAASAAQAVRHITESLFTVAVATSEQLVSLLTSGAKVEDAKQEGGGGSFPTAEDVKGILGPAEQRKEIGPQANVVNDLALEKAPEEISSKPAPEAAATAGARAPMTGIAEDPPLNSGAGF